MTPMSLLNKKTAGTIIAVLIVLCIIFAALWLAERRTADRAFSNPYPLVDPSRAFIEQKNFIVNLEPLREELARLVAERDDWTVVLYFEFLNTGSNISLNPNTRVWPASLLKLPMAIAVMKRVENGAWSLQDELELKESDRGKKYGTLWQAPVGSTFTIERLLREMLANSDNTAYNIFARQIEFDEFIDIVVELGIEDLFNEAGLMSAKEYSRLFRSLYASSLVNRERSQQLLTMMGESGFEDFIGNGIPEGVLFSHKFGVQEDLHTYLDSGIVYVPGRPYVITAGVKGTGKPGEREDIEAFMKEIGEATFTYVRDR